MSLFLTLTLSFRLIRLLITTLKFGIWFSFFFFQREKVVSSIVSCYCNVICNDTVMAYCNVMLVMSMTFAAEMHLMKK